MLLSASNEDASHAPTARKLNLDAPPNCPCGCFPSARFPKSVFENKKEKDRGGVEEEGENEEKGRKGDEVASANSLPEWLECSACV